jgi:HD superfamily phosphodiesterase
MIKVWAACVITALIFIVSVPFILSGKADHLIATDEAKLQSDMKRLRILMAILSSTATAFCITFPFLMIGGYEKEMFLMIAALTLFVITIIILSKTWAKKI